MRTLLPLALVLVVAGCAAPAPAVAPVTPPRPPVVAPPPPEPLDVTPAPEVVEVEPVEPPPVPEMRIDRRSVFERAGTVEWTLANGLTVVYAHAPDAEGYSARVVAPLGSSLFNMRSRGAFDRGGRPRWGSLSARIEGHDRVATGSADGIQSLLSDVARMLTQPPDEGGAGHSFEVSPYTLIVLLGPREHAWVEPAVAATLGALRPDRDALVATADVDPNPWVPGEWSDLPAVRVLDRALADRSGPGAGVRFDAAAGRIQLVVPEGVPRPVLLARFDDAELRRARDRAATEAAAPEGRLEAFAALYGLPGAFRPARDPTEAARLADRIVRTPPAAAAELLRRLADAR